jgi:hypothetical protein
MTCKEKKPSVPKEIAYYQFTPEDMQRLLPYTKGQVLKFTNQNNKERTFTIHSVNTIKKQRMVGSGFFSSDYFYYDVKEITLIDSKTKWFDIYFNRYPLDEELAKNDRYTKYPSKFYGCTSFIPFWNGFENGMPRISINYEQTKIEMAVNGKIYKNVFILDSGSDSVIWDEFSRDVNVIYYDEIEGIIGFDDLNGNQWRLIK